MGLYEFFAGGGMARIGLGTEFSCLFANDLDKGKASAYRAFFGSSETLVVGDVAALETSNLPGQADLAWASFPCQDLSLAGNGVGLNGKRSGVFWAFWRLMKSLRAEGRAPRMIILENVRGAITSHQGRDLAAICEALSQEGYKFAPMVIDAQLFLPQSRPRLFVVAFGPDALPSLSIVGNGPMAPWHPNSFKLPFERLSHQARDAWVWLSLPIPSNTPPKLSDIIEDVPEGVSWHTPLETKRLLGLMSPLHLEKISQAKCEGGRRVGTVYKRTRLGEDGKRRQRAEVRFDEVAGCLRTPAGGSSRQIVLIVEGKSVRSRLLSSREAARLMGLPEEYPLPQKYNEAYKLVGDGVAVPVVSWLAQNVIKPSLVLNRSQQVA
ncbi:MAG: DNA cytosine methyltransferase [Desulfomicrobium sp.]|nr:DNA cytosine methyltransferase [Pseudomonadota bacterium]MBV1710780.1 DNA cytosine methyltransferase [Desulfomicrobium sp.]MBU4570388.1 DNA cytosine methyltransferase [Pseudomonadota bacterium]MBU4593309.1 DNA cytosine methyltransferase [Pseudomonadota bacterium]MBV1721571.1 DNA cytosine methyltransferase [Desulfomicrobium sp.]